MRMLADAVCEKDRQDGRTDRTAPGRRRPWSPADLVVQAVGGLIEAAALSNDPHLGVHRCERVGQIDVRLAPDALVIDEAMPSRTARRRGVELQDDVARSRAHCGRGRERSLSQP